MIEKAKRPLLLIGAGANRKPVSKALDAFIAKTPIPFFATQMGKGVLDENHPLSLGTAAISDKDFVHVAIAHADLIINFGHDVVEKPPFIMEHGKTKVLHINYSSAEVDEVYFPQLEVLGDLSVSVEKLTQKLKPQKHWDFSYLKAIKAALDEDLNAGTEKDSFPIFPPRLIKDVHEVMPKDGMLALDNGMYKIWFARNYRAYLPNTVLLDNALATMGAGLPSAMGAKIVHPDRKVVAVCGDGGFLMNSHELEPAVRLGLDLVILLLRDDAYGMIKWKQTNMGLPSFGLDFGNPDFVKYAQSYGAHGHRVNDTQELKTTLEKCLNSKGVHLIDVPMDYSENNYLLGESLTKKIARLQKS